MGVERLFSKLGRRANEQFEQGGVEKFFVMRHLNQI